MTLAKLGPEVVEDDIGQPRLSVRLRDVTKRFGNFIAVEKVSLDIEAGAFFVIVGPSGCGKTTLLRILAGLDPASSGSIEVCAEPGSNRPLNSMVFQGDSIFPWMTVWDNAAYGLAMRGVPKAQICEVVAHYLDRTGLTPIRKHLSPPAIRRHAPARRDRASLRQRS